MCRCSQRVGEGPGSPEAGVTGSRVPLDVGAGAKPGSSARVVPALQH